MSEKKQELYDPVILRGYSIKKDMLNFFLEELLILFDQKVLTGVFVVDSAIKKSTIFTTPEGYGDLLMFFEQRLFFKATSKVELLAHKYLITKPEAPKELEIGAEVLFLLDGKVYRVIELSTDKKKATIKSTSTDEKALLLKVKSETLKRKS